MKKLILLISIIFFTGCAGTKKTVTETRERVETFTQTNEVKLDTTIFIPGEKVSLFVPLKELIVKKNEKPKVFTKRLGRTSVTIRSDTTGITTTSNCDSIAEKLTYYKKEVKQLQLVKKAKKTTITEKKGYSLLELILYIIATAIISFAAAYLLKTFRIV